MNSWNTETLRRIEGHSFGNEDDSRPRIFDYREKKWKTMLHPALHCLAPILSKISMYLSIPWEHWPEIVEDHVHEAIAIYLIEMGVILKQNGDPIELQEKERSVDLFGYAASFVINTHDITSPRSKSKKRTGDNSQTKAPKRSKTKLAQCTGAQAGPSRTSNGLEEGTNQTDL